MLHLEYSFLRTKYWYLSVAYFSTNDQPWLSSWKWLVEFQFCMQALKRSFVVSQELKCLLVWNLVYFSTYLFSVFLFLIFWNSFHEETPWFLTVSHKPVRNYIIYFLEHYSSGKCKDGKVSLHLWWCGWSSEKNQTPEVCGRNRNVARESE